MQEERRDRKRGGKFSCKVRRSDLASYARLPMLAPVKQLSAQQESFVRRHRCFLVRNLEKVRRARDNLQKKVRESQMASEDGDNYEMGPSAKRKNGGRRRKPEDMIMTGLTALTTARSMQTRRLASANDDPNVTKVIKLAQLLREIFAQITTVADKTGENLSRFFNTLPSKKKHPKYYEVLEKPIDLQTIEKSINTGGYQSAEEFDRDVLWLCQNNLRYYGRHTQEGKAALEIRKMYIRIKQEYHGHLLEILRGESVKEDGSSTPKAAISSDQISASARCFEKQKEEAEDDVIRCPCGLYNDEGMMVQCDKCLVWQHCDCVGKEGGVTENENYVCEQCEERKVDLDIQLRPQPEYASPGETYYTSLLRDDLQVCVGDTVYVLRAFKQGKGEEEKKDNPPAEEEVPMEVDESVETDNKQGSDNEDKDNNKEVKEALPSVNNAEVEEGREDSAKTDEAKSDHTPVANESGDNPDNEHGSPKKKSKTEVTLGGIQHKLMSPTKGPSLEASSLTKGNYPTYQTVDPSVTTVDDMDIFCIDRLWVSDSGKRFAFGHHYLRPHETFHEPSRRFYPNEVFRVPLYEVLPLDSIWGKCWVMDPVTFCRGRPFGAVEEHSYICEFRVDKGAR